MDPLTVIGTAGAVANIVDLIGKTIGAIYQLRQEWKEADLTLLSLTAQLTALRGALNKIKEWVECDLENSYYQAAMDLDASVACCKILIGKIDAVLSTLYKSPDENLDFASKLRLVSGSRTIKNVQDMIQNQTSALTLLLTVMNRSGCRRPAVLVTNQPTARIYLTKKLCFESRAAGKHSNASKVTLGHSLFIVILHPS
jgi:hypothetical protein